MAFLCVCFSHSVSHYCKKCFVLFFFFLFSRLQSCYTESSALTARGVVAAVAGCSTQDCTGSIMGKLQQGIFMNFCLTCKCALHNHMSVRVHSILALNIGSSAQEAEVINQIGWQLEMTAAENFQWRENIYPVTLKRNESGFIDLDLGIFPLSSHCFNQAGCVGWVMCDVCQWIKWSNPRCVAR